MKIVSVPIFIWPDVVDVTDQDCMDTLCDTSIVGDSACYTRHHLTTTFCCPTCLIPTEINFGMIGEKIDVVNKALPYVIIFVARIVTVLSFICCCVIVAEFFDSFYLEPAPISNPPCNVIIVFITHITSAIDCATGSTLDNIS